MEIFSVIQVAVIKVEKSTLTGMKDSINTEINASLQEFQFETSFLQKELFAFCEFSKKFFLCSISQIL